MEITMQKLGNTGTVPATIADTGKVRLGGGAPSLPPVRAIPASVADSGKVRLGGGCPAL
jgi:hypothetical protein